MKTNSMRANSIFALVLFLLALPAVLADEIFKVENDQSEPKTVTVKTIEHRPATSNYVVRGKVQHRDVEGAAYLEMWSIMPDGSRYFSRTVGYFGPTRKIQGNSGWRKFELPFNLMGHKPETVTLEINVVMPGKGTIELSDLETYNLPPVWLSNNFGGILGGVLGVFWGIYGGVFGCLCGFLGARGKGRRLLTGMLLFAFVMGIVQLLTGISALLLGHPYEVWFPLVLIGGLLAIFSLHTFWWLKKAYAQAELRKMQALDA